MKKNGRPHNHELQCLRCEREVFARYLCKKHYNAVRYQAIRERRIARGEVPRARPRPYGPGDCLAAGCAVTTVRDGLCKAHNKRRMRWGLSVERFVELVAVDSCEACGEVAHPGRPLVFDHDHSHCERGCAECIRGVLCSACNLTLGHARESVSRLKDVAKYASRVLSL